MFPPLSRALDWVPLLVALLLYGVALDWGWGPEAFWSWDEPRPAEIVAEPYGEAPSWPAKYPLLHRDVLRALFAAVEPIARATGVTEAAALDRTLFLAGRALSLLLALATLRILFLVAQRLAGRRAGWIASILWLAVLPQAYYAKTMNLEAPYIFWFALSVLAFVRYRDDPRSGTALAFGTIAAAAVLTKDQAYGLYLLPGLFLLIESVRRCSRERRIEWHLLVAFVAAIALASISFRLWRGAGMLRDHLYAVAAHPGTYAFTAESSAGTVNLAISGLRHIAWIFSVPLAAIVMLAAGSSLVRAFRASKSETARPVALLLFPLSYVLFSLVPLGYHYDRFFLPVAWILAAVAGVEIAGRLAALPGSTARAMATAALAFAIGYALLRVLAVDVAMVSDRRGELEEMTRGAARAAFYAREVRPPRGFDRHPVRRGESVAPTSLSPYEVVVIPALDLGELGLSRLAARLRGGECGFREEQPGMKASSRLRRFPGFDRIHSNLSEIDPPLLVFRRDLPLGPCGVAAASAEPVH